MNCIRLAATTSWLLKPVELLLSFIFDGVFYVVTMFTSNHSLAITIVLFTVIVRALMIPLMMKQQRSSRAMTRLQPKVEQIQNKYKNKKDPESSQKMNMEIQELYKKHKANPMSGCLPLLIQMPILFALFEILRNVPFYVNQIGDIYNSMALQVQSISGYADILTNNFQAVINSLQDFDMNTTESIMDLLYHLSREQWTVLRDVTGLAGNATFEANYALQASYNTFGVGAFTFNLSESPGWTGIGIIFPLLSGGTTFLQSWLAQRASEKRQKMASADGKIKQQNSMKMMTYIFPVMTAFFTASMPLGLGVYWIAGNIFSIFSQMILDSIIDREEYKEALKRKEELIEKRKLKEASKSNIDKMTGNRIGTAHTVNKSSMAGNKIAAMKQEQKERELYKKQLEEKKAKEQDAQASTEKKEEDHK